MRIVLAVIILAAACTGSAHAADMAIDAPGGGAAVGDCNCDSGMITIYDSEPGVVKRNWKGECECRVSIYRPTGGYRVAAPVVRYESLIEPWRR